MSRGSRRPLFQSCSSVARRSLRREEPLRQPLQPMPQSTRFSRLSIQLSQAIGTASQSVRMGATKSKKGLMSSFPIRTVGDAWEIVQNVPLNDFSRRKIDASVNELKEEKGLVTELLG